MRSEFTKITPSLAEHFLSKNRMNRSINYDKVNKYANEMKNGTWRETHQGIAFYDDDSIADGQHRLIAIINSKSTIWMLVTYDLKKDASLGIDYHRPRSLVDGIKIGGFSDWIDFKHIAIINTIAGGKRLSTVDSIAWLDKLKESVLFSCDHLSQRRFITNASSQAAVTLAHHNGIDEVLLKRFCDVLVNGVAERKTESVIIRLRDDFLNNASQSRSIKAEKFYKAQRVILAFSEGEILTRLFTPKEPIWIFNGDE